MVSENRWTKISTVIIVIVLFIISLGLMKFIGGEFFSKIDKGEFLVQIELPKRCVCRKDQLYDTQKAEDYLSKNLKL